MTRRFATFPPFEQFDALLHQIRGLSYRARRQFLWHRVRPRLDRFLYKFRALVPADEVSVDRLRDVLVRSELWLSSPSDFNDPFDMSAKFVADGTLKQKQDRIQALLKRQNLTWKERRRVAPSFVAKSSEELAASAQAAHQRAVEQAGVYSFAGDPNSILMWSHYAANHEGFCLQFEVAQDMDTIGRAVPVEYDDQYPVVNWITEFEKGLLSSVLRKHTGWRYEQETRIVIPAGAHQYLPFRPEALRAIILGYRVKEPTLAKLRELLAERSSRGLPSPRLYRAAKHDTRYRLVISRETKETGG